MKSQKTQALIISESEIINHRRRSDLHWERGVIPRTNGYADAS